MPTILAADIGGTNSRFGWFEARSGSEPRLLESCAVPTAAVRSLAELFTRLRDEGFGLRPGEADRIVLAVAGPVRDGRVSRLTNASWGVDPADPANHLPPGKTLLVNDFVAQALGCTLESAKVSAVTVQDGPVRPGVVAAVGPGTGLGLCALVPLPGGGVLPLPSEGGHAPLAMIDRHEFAFLEFLQARTGHSHAFGDLVVSGPGLSLVHCFLTGRDLPPAAAAAEIGPDSETAAWFARFLGRSCRSYALCVLAWGGVNLCGGVAVRNPFLADHHEFRREFRDSPAYGEMLGAIPVRLVTGSDTGLCGAAKYGAMALGS